MGLSSKKITPPFAGGTGGTGGTGGSLQSSSTDTDVIHEEDEEEDDTRYGYYLRPENAVTAAETRHHIATSSSSSSSTASGSTTRNLNAALDAEAEEAMKAEEEAKKVEEIAAKEAAAAQKALIELANNQRIVEYILDQLKIDTKELDKFNHDGSTTSLLKFNDKDTSKGGCVLSGLPAGLVASSIDDKTAEKVYHDWEVKRKIMQVASSCDALKKSVRRTEMFVKQQSAAILKEEEDMSPLRRIINALSPRKTPSAAVKGKSHFTF